MKILYVRCASGAPQYHPKDKALMYKNWDLPIQSFVGIDDVQKALGDLPEEVNVIFSADGEFTGVERRGR